MSAHQSLTDALLARIDELERRLARVEAGAPSESGDRSVIEAGAPSESGDRSVIDRRHLLHAGAAVAGGAALVVVGARPAEAASGTFDGNPAVEATGLGGPGVYATTDDDGSGGVEGRTSTNGAWGVLGATTAVGGSGAGVRGAGSGARTGVWGYSAAGDGVLGTSDGTAVHGASYSESGRAGFFESNGFGVRVIGDPGVHASSFTYPLIAEAPSGTTLAQLQLLAPVGYPVPTARADAHARGELYLDGNGDLWSCTAAGSPGTWRKLSGPATAGALHVLATPARIYDSRPGDPPLGVAKGVLADGAERVINANFTSALPGGTTAVVVNVTVANTSASGFLAVWRNGVAWPGTSTVNWFQAGSVVANQTLVALDGALRFKAKVAAGASTDFLVDLLAYWR
jgi:hypothetical protein